MKKWTKIYIKTSLKKAVINLNVLCISRNNGLCFLLFVLFISLSGWYEFTTFIQLCHFFASCQHCTTHDGQRLYVLKVWPCQLGNLLMVKARRKTQSPTLDFFEYDCGKDRSMCLVVGAGDEICETFLRGKNPQVYENNPAWPPECKTTIFRIDCLCQRPTGCLFVN